MTKNRNIMTKRTFGLLTTLSVLSIGAFTAALVLAYPNPNIADASGTGNSNTMEIDKSRTVANTDSSLQAARSAANVPANQSTQPNSDIQNTQNTAQGQNNTTQPSSAPMPASPSTQTQQSQASPAQSSQPISNSSSQPNLVEAVKDALGHVADLLPL